jgi:hypothetical protein
MPSFKQLTEQEVRQLQERRIDQDLVGEYVDFLGNLDIGDWGEVELTAADKRRTVKRRLSVAASSRGQAIHWRRSVEADRLVFVLQARS